MDINTLRGLSVIFVFIAFMGVCWWAFSPKRKKKFEEAANLPFADEDNAKGKQQDQQVTGEKSSSNEDKTSS